MPSLNFKKQFEPFVHDHTKTHTLRAGSRFKVGDVCHCFTGLRTKNTKLLGRWKCVKVEDVRLVISVGCLQIYFDGQALSEDEMREFCYRDGFRSLGPARSVELFIEFWSDEHNLGPLGAQEWTGQLIHWDVRQPFVKEAK